MKTILHLAPLVEAIVDPPPGGAEKLAFDLARYQVSHGYRVQVIAATGSLPPPGVEFVDLGIPPGKLIPVDTALSASDYSSPINTETRMKIEEEVFRPVAQYLENSRYKVDILHNHAYDLLPLTQLGSLGIRTVHTLQLPPIVPWINDALRALSSPTNVCYVVLSKAAQELYHRNCGKQFQVIYNGIDLSQFPKPSMPEDYYLWAGRVSPEKGLHTAIDVVVRELGKRLIAVGRVYNEKYFQEEIRPRLTDQRVTYLGPRPHHELLELMSKSRALVFPLEWEEPFGLVIAESLAAGTPVVAFNRGAAREIIEHGVTGYLVSELRELGAALQSVGKLNRALCRESVVKQFSLAKSAANYESLYQELRDA